MNWKQIVGHEEQIRNIKAMLVSGRIAHAMLFAGAEGIGKGLVARVAAAGIMCNSSAEIVPCGQCLSCRMLQKESNPDFFLIKPEGLNIKISQIRRLQKEAAFFPKIGKQKVIVLEAADRMTSEAANSLLKLLEEPPEYLKFILVVNAVKEILPTIVSRCQGFRFLPPTQVIIAQSLVNSGVDVYLAELAARLCGGKIEMARKIVAPQGLAVRDQAVTYLTKLFKQTYDMEEILLIATDMEKLGSNQVIVLLRYFTLILRDLVLIKASKDYSLVYNIDLANVALLEMSEGLNAKNLLLAIKAVQQAHRALAVNANLRMTAEALLLRLVDLMRGEYSA